MRPLLELYELLWEQIKDREELKSNISLHSMVIFSKKEYRMFIDDFPYQIIENQSHDKIQANIIKRFIRTRINELT